MSNKLWKHPQYGHVENNEVFMTPVGRLAWISLDKPKPGKIGPDGSSGFPAYEVQLILDPESDAVVNFFDEIDKEQPEMLALFNQGREMTFGACNSYKLGSKNDLEKYPFYKDKVYIVARNAKSEAFKCVGKDPKVLCPRDFFKGGMLGRLLVSPRLTTHGISYKLHVVQFAKDDGVRYGGGVMNYDSLLTAIEGAEGDGVTDEQSQMLTDSIPEQVFGKAEPVAPTPPVAAAPVAQATPAKQRRSLLEKPPAAVAAPAPAENVGNKLLRQAQLAAAQPTPIAKIEAPKASVPGLAQKLRAQAAANVTAKVGGKKAGLNLLG